MTTITIQPWNDPIIDTIGATRRPGWAEADRASKGDVHNARPAARDDAWLAARNIGALILRLAGAPRSSA